MGLRPTEQAVRDYFTKEGFSATKQGYPDFLIYRRNGDLFEYCFIEVKSPEFNIISQQQKAMFALLRSKDIPVYVINNLEDVKKAKFQSFGYTEYRKYYREFMKNSKRFKPI